MRTARRQAAVLAFSRRTNARPCLNILTQDAVALVAEVVRTELSGSGHVVDGNTLSLRILSSELDTEAIGAVVHESPLRGEDSMAGYALGTGRSRGQRGLEKRDSLSRPLPLQPGNLQCGLTVPLHQNKEPIGTLGVYCRQPRRFSDDDLQFAETIAHLLTSSIARVKAEEALRQERSLAAAILDAVESLIVVLDADGKIVDVNQSCREVAGYSIERIRRKPFINIFAPEDLELFRGALHEAFQSRAPGKLEAGLLTKDGRRLCVGWTLRVTCDPSGLPQAAILSGVLREKQAEQPFHPSSPQGGGNNRASQRRVFQYRQRIAPLVGSSKPAEKDFIEVECCDISAGGLAFYLDRAPSSRASSSPWGGRRR